MQEKSLSHAVQLSSTIADSLAQAVSDYVDKINDTDGHSAVLECIQHTAESLTECLSELEEHTR